mmetsp:Transcript_107915/g.302243  ORF Transcript_107915/g.302243 Transcript_107915/m.302243 type:complete len:229 (-) Transcript_107915:786-1472(-)
MAPTDLMLRRLSAKRSTHAQRSTSRWGPLVVAAALRPCAARVGAVLLFRNLALRGALAPRNRRASRRRGSFESARKLPKPAVGERLLGARPLLRVHLQQAPDEVQALLGDLREPVGGEGVSANGDVRHELPLRTAGEGQLAGQQGERQHAHAPQVGLDAVRAPHPHTRGDHLGRHVRRGARRVRRRRPAAIGGEPKVDELHTAAAAAVEDGVLELHVPVGDAPPVEVR